jgi:uncharacterized membrane protein
MTESEDPIPTGSGHGRETNEFARVANLSDAVFAIAMTLLVLTIDVPDVASAGLASALREDLPQLGAYALAFALVASQWYAHHKLFRRLAWLDARLIVTNLVYLALVALVPFPTSVLGAHPTTTVAVAPFLALFVVLNLVYLLLIVHAHRVGAWTEPLPAAVFRRVVSGSLTATTTLALGVVASLWVPLLAIAVAALSSTPYLLVMRSAPPRYRTWF